MVEPRRPSPHRAARAAVELRRVGRSYPKGGLLHTVLDEVSLTLSPGDFVALTGASGAGKSTILELIAGLERPSSGEVLVAGRALGPMTDDELARLRLSTIGLLFQEHQLIPTLSAAENVALPLLLAGVARRAALRRADDLAGRLGLGDRGGELPDALSLGERQRLCIARALVNEPDVLLADEPTAGLDSVAADEVMRLLREQAEEDGRTVLIATHDARAAAHADAAYRLRGGQLEPG